MQDMVVIVLEYLNYVIELEVVKIMGDLDYELVVLKGQLFMVNFWDEDGGVYLFYVFIQDLFCRRVEFIMSLFKWEQDSFVFVVVFGYGLGNFKEFIYDGFIMGDCFGMVMIVIDYFNYGFWVIIFDVLKELYIFMVVLIFFMIMQLLGMFV